MTVSKLTFVREVYPELEDPQWRRVGIKIEGSHPSEDWQHGNVCCTRLDYVSETFWRFHQLNSNGTDDRRFSEVAGMITMDVRDV
jgi:hypothetical protein